MRIIDADALRDILVRMSHTANYMDPPVKRGIEGSIRFLDAQSSIECETCGRGEGNGGQCGGTFWVDVRKPGQKGGTGCSAWEGK